MGGKKQKIFLVKIIDYKENMLEMSYKWSMWLESLLYYEHASVNLG